MNDTNTINAYLRTKVMTASPEELRMLLLDGALRFANMAKYGMENSDHEKIYEGFTQSRAIVLELTDTIDPSHDPELANNVRGIYVFIYGQLIKASIEKDITKLDEAIRLLEYERETWAKLMEQLVEDRKAGIVAPSNAPANAPASQEAPAMSSLSVEA
ncbi:MAG: flagellar export chaperone FliS [Phycisphaerales bacterium]